MAFSSSSKSCLCSFSSIAPAPPKDVLVEERMLTAEATLTLPAVAVGVVAADPGFRPSKLAKWASRASSKLLGA